MHGVLAVPHVPGDEAGAGRSGCDVVGVQHCTPWHARRGSPRWVGGRDIAKGRVGGGGRMHGTAYTLLRFPETVLDERRKISAGLMHQAKKQRTGEQ